MAVEDTVPRDAEDTERSVSLMLNNESRSLLAYCRRQTWFKLTVHGGLLKQ